VISDFADRDRPTVESLAKETVLTLWRPIPVIRFRPGPFTTVFQKKAALHLCLELAFWIGVPPSIVLGSFSHLPAGRVEMETMLHEVFT
jgi:hypothetical protein